MPIFAGIETIKNSINVVRWDKVPDAVGYELDVDGTIVEIGNRNQYVHKNLAVDSVHKYRIRAVGRNSVSEWSSVQSKNVQGNNLKGIFNTLSIGAAQTATAAESPQPQVEAQMKVSDPKTHNGLEWVEAGGDAISGVYIEAIKAKLDNVPSGMSIKYQVYVNGSWQECKSDWQETDIVPGQYVQKVKMMISGGDEKYSIQYSLGSTTNPDSPIVTDGQESGKYGNNAEGFYVNLFDNTKYKEIDINQDTTWGPGLNVIDGYVKVSHNATLTIKPGAIIQFNKDSSDISGMEVDGKVIAQGTSALPIIFKCAGTDTQDDYEFRSITINKDGEFLGDYINESVQDIGTNGFLVNGKFSLSNSQVIDPGNIKLSNGIIIRSDKDVSIVNSTISNFANGICLSGSGNFTIDKNDIFNNYDGIYIDNETVTTCANIMIGHEYIANDTQKQKIHNNDTGIEVFDDWNEHDRITIDSNIVDSNESYGLYICATCAGPFRLEANEFTNNALTKSELYGPIFVNLGGLVNHESDIFNIFNAINPNDSNKNNNVTNNGYDAVVMYGTASSSITLPKGNLRYLAVNVNIPSGQSFNIKPGVIMNILGHINVWGQLRASGADDSGNKETVILCQVDNSSYGIKHTSKGTDEDKKEKYFDNIFIGDKGVFSGNNVKVIGGGASLGSIANFGNLILSDSEVFQPYSDAIMNVGKSVLVNVNINNNFNYKSLTKEDAEISHAIDSDGDITLINSKISNAYDGLYSYGGKNLIIGTTFDSNSVAIDAGNETDVFNSKITNSGCCAVIIGDGGENSKFNNNSFINNGQTFPYGDHSESASFINLISPSMIDARGNYWGAATGPRVYDYSNNKWIGDLNADSVDTYVNISGYLAQEPKPVDLGSNFSNYIKSVQYVTQMHFGEKGVNPGSGNYCRTYTDMNISFSGINLKLGRTYNSKDDKSNNMGRGWRFNFQGKIEDYNDDSGKFVAKMVYLPDGSVQAFTSGKNGYEPQNSRSKLTKQADGTYILVTSDETAYGFNKDGIMYWIRDKYGNYITLIIDNNKNVSKILDPRGRYFQINYKSVNGNNNLIDSITEYVYDPTYDNSALPPKIVQYFKTGRTIKYNYNENNILESVTDTLGNVTEHYVYDEKGYLSQILDENKEIKESVSYYHEDDKNKDRVKQVTDSFGNTQNYSYDYDFGRTIITDSQGKQNEQWYDKQMYTYMVVNPDKKFTYTVYNTENGVNKYGEQKFVYDRNGNVTKYDRDSNGNVTKKTNPDSSCIQYQYDDQNNVIKEINETGEVTYNVYDTVYNGSFNSYSFYPYLLPLGSIPDYNVKYKILVKKAQPLNGQDEYKAGCDESKFAVTSYSYYGDDECSKNNYRVKGLIKSVTDPRGNTNAYTYDSNGNPVTITNEEGKVTKYQYNNLGFKDWSISPSGYKTQYNYDMNGNLLRTILHGGETTRTVYDIEGRKIKEISANLYKASADNLSDNSYSEDKGTRYTYYPHGKVHTLLDAGNNLTSYTYDAYGNVSTETKPNNSIYTYEYDDANRIKTVRFQDNINSASQVLEEYDYEIVTKQVDSGDGSKTAEMLTKKTEWQYYLL